MKIGILTQPLHNNYGGILQAYALQKVLINMGHESIVINRDIQKSNVFKKVKYFLISTVKYLLRYDALALKKYRESKIQKKYASFIGNNTSRFIEKHIIKTKAIYSTLELKKESKKGYHAFIVGSDQVWRPSMSPKIENYFFDFVKNKTQFIKISYAASFGVNQWQFTPYQTKICQQLVKEFNAVSVRERSGVDLCKKYLKVDAKIVLDPTLLLPKEQYIELTQIKNCENKAVIFSYILDKDPNKQDILKRIVKETNLSLSEILPDKNYELITNKNISNYVFQPVETWIEQIARAKLIITDSFHGCAFSILFNKNFIVVTNEVRGITRIESLLSIFNLTNRIVYKNSDIMKTLNKEINWKQINEILNKERQESLSFLNQHLNI